MPDTVQVPQSVIVLLRDGALSHQRMSPGPAAQLLTAAISGRGLLKGVVMSPSAKAEGYPVAVAPHRSIDNAAQLVSVSGGVRVSLGEAHKV